MQKKIAILLISCLAAVCAQTCVVDSTYAAGNCAIETSGCLFSTPALWSCGDFPHTQSATADLTTTGSYQVNLDSTVAVDPLPLMNLFIGEIAGGNSTKVLSISGVGLSILGQATVQPYGKITIDSGASSIGGAIDVNGNAQIEWLSGTIASPISLLQVRSGGRIDMPAGSRTLNQRLTNDGSMTLSGGASLTIDSMTLSNTGTFLISDGSTISGSGILSNSGNGKLSIFQTTSANPVEFSCTLNSYGGFEVVNGTLNLKSSSSFSNLNIASGSSVNLDGGPFTIISTLNLGTLTWKSGDITISGAINSTNAFLLSGADAEATLNFNTAVGSATSFINRGTFTSSYAGTANFLGSGTFINYGTMFLNSGSLNFAKFTMAGTGIALFQSAPMSVGTLIWNSGDCQGLGTLTVTGSAMFSGGIKTFNGRSINFAGTTLSNVNAPIQLRSGAGITIQPATPVRISNTIYCDPGSSVVNSGVLSGSMTIHGTFVNTGILGDGQVSAIVNVNGSASLDDNSQIIFDLFSDSGFSKIGVTGEPGLLQLAGSVVIRPRVGLYGSNGLTLTVISTKSVSGALANVSLDLTQWDNPTACGSVSYQWASAGTQLIVIFDGCGGNTPVPPPPGSSRLRTFAIIIVVIAFIITAVGLVAYCQKKYKKKPWDRLRDDRI